jgi:hypothetical protein
MSTANTALLYNLGLIGTPVDDDLVAFAAGTQAGATPIRGELARVTSAASNASCVLKSIANGEAAALTFVVNDSPSAIVVFCGFGEKLNGSTNGGLTIPSGQSGIFVRVPNALQSVGADWRAAAIP